MDAAKTSIGFTTVVPKTIHYFSNGTGRDSYIATNCGGLVAPKELKTAFELGMRISPNVFIRHVPITKIISRKDTQN